MDPLVVEFPLSKRSVPITVNTDFFIRNHFSAPDVDLRSYELVVEGEVRHPLKLTWDQIASLPRVKQTAVLECAGNNRGFLETRRSGVQWKRGGVGCAEWGGVQIAKILEIAQPLRTAAHVVFLGADYGYRPRSKRKQNFSRSLPLSEASRAEMILAYEMNGERLPPMHGGPLRAIIPGWYAMASVKWVTRIILSRRAFRGVFQTVEYTYRLRSDEGLVRRVPVTRLQTKAQIVWPTSGELLRNSSRYTIYGVAWSSGDVVSVEVTTDNGRSWNPARLLRKRGAYAWHFWDYQWMTSPVSERSIVMARAIDKSCRTQPVYQETDCDGYMIRKIEPTIVVVE